MNKLEVRMIRHAKGNHMLNPDLIAGRSMDAILTDEGVTDAGMKGRELVARGIVFDRVVSSRAVRCIQTAKHILDAAGVMIEIEPTDDLLEMDQGDYAGRRRADVYNEMVLQQIVEHGKDFALPGGESMNQVGLRGLRWLKKQSAETPDANRCILVVAHAGLITHTAGQIEGWDQATSLARLKSMPPLGETMFSYNGQNWHVETFAQPVQPTQ